ncbi:MULTISPECIES: hypothetical protein [unclassified Lysobacter]|uniref:hypothetical protein n=1 Tax=unclassified Lysobacter TaxID=2635362 RepID=UPI001BE57052|nr:MULTISPECIES: hypothetical protein [unclassified Lysobacter]MBT2746593.1 hypothetical protein [Lysobacter sp. ISL-42]MBT2753412.1 hypothetical protein [Lysobacter sp. ISL-50]MBT2775522.1 hypothetical protein [Lysobacter sp. ISL-54]MBT2782942.1 hypothetical protein [Lysobacter sp. ISL-52]
MWRTLVFVAALGGLGTSTPLHAALKEPTAESRREEAQKNQQQRLQALTRRGRLTAYQQLLGTGKVSVASSATAAEASSRDAAIDLAALGFTAADVKAYRGRNIDLFDVAQRFFEGATSPTEQMVMADTVVIATAGEVQAGRNRIDGFLSEIPFAIVKSLKGSRVAGDVVFVPRSSGPLGDGTEQIDFSDIQFTPGKKYLLVLSKNWYEQFVALGKKQAETSFTALPYVAYEVAGNNTLLRISRTLKAGADPKNVESVEAELKRVTEGKSQARGLK